VPIDAAALVVELAVLVNATVADAAVADAVDSNPPSPEVVNPPPAVILFSIAATVLDIKHVVLLLGLIKKTITGNGFSLVDL
jgi:hypothetical protein